MKVLGHMENSYKLRELGPMKKTMATINSRRGGGELYAKKGNNQDLSVASS